MTSWDRGYTGSVGCMVTLLTEIKFGFYYFEQKLKRKMQLAETIPNHTTISVTEMVVCNRDGG